MAFSEYRGYKVSDLKQMFQIEIRNNADLFRGLSPSRQEYAELQAEVTAMSSRLRLSTCDNEATRGSLLVSHILWKACEVNHLGVFFEPLVALQPEDTPNLPHQLNGTYDGGVSLDEIDFIAPIVAVVEVKRSRLAEGFGQCVAEMYATLKAFEQEKVYGIITDGDVWEFLLLEHEVLSVDAQNYHIRYVADIIDRIGYIAERFRIP